LNQLQYHSFPTRRSSDLDGALRALFTLCREPRSLLYLLQSSPGEEHMDIIAQLKAERDKAAQQVSALDTAIGALSGLNSTRAPRSEEHTSELQSPDHLVC